MPGRRPDPGFPIEASEFKRVLKDWGFELTEGTRHEQWRYPGSTVIVTVRRGNAKVSIETVKRAAQVKSLPYREFLKGKPKTVRPSKITPARRGVIKVLAEAGGGVRSDLGDVTAILSERTTNTPTWMSNLLREMEADGQVFREVRGRRTYGVGLNKANLEVQQMLLDAGLIDPLLPVAPKVTSGVAVEDKAVAELLVAAIDQPIDQSPTPTPEAHVVDFSGFTPEDIADALLSKVVAFATRETDEVHWKAQAQELQLRVEGLVQELANAKHDIIHWKTLAESYKVEVEKLKDRAGGRAARLPSAAAIAEAATKP